MEIEQDATGAGRRTAEWVIDVLLWQEIEVDTHFAAWLLSMAFGKGVRGDAVTAVSVTPWEPRGNGETDLVVRATVGAEELVLHVEDKLWARWSDPSQPTRYREHVDHSDNMACLLIAPQQWITSHQDGVGAFDAHLAHEAVAGWLAAHADGDGRRLWVAERIRTATLPSSRGTDAPAPEISEWVQKLAELASELGLQPRPDGYVRKEGTEGKQGRFIPYLSVLPGPGDPWLAYKVAKPSLANTRVDLIWDRPPPALAEEIASAAESAGYVVTWSDSGAALFVRVEGGDDFGALTLLRPIEEQGPAAIAMLEAAAGLRSWWHVTATTIRS